MGLRRLLFGLMALCMVGSCMANDAAIDMSPCGLSDRQVLFGKSLAFHADVASDGIHFIKLRPSACPQEMYGFLPGKKGDGAAVLIEESVYGFGNPGTTDKRIEVDIDATAVRLPTGKLGFRMDKLRRLVLTYTHGE